MSTTGKYIVASLCALAMALTGLSLSACRTTHLGPSYGTTYDDALQAQRESEDGPTLTAKDAKKVLTVHAHGKSSQTSASGASGDSAMVAPSSAGGSSGTLGGSWGGASGNITLDAK